MAKILTYRRWSYALHLFRRWLSNKFSAIKIDLTPVEEKIDEVSDKIDHIDVESADNLAQFFGVTELQGYEFMTDTEVTDEIEDIMQAIDNELTPEQAAEITTEAMEIINTQNL